MLACEAKRLGNACLIAILLQVACVQIGCASARSLQQTVLPQGSDACNSYVQSSCTPLDKPAPRSDSCSQRNTQQLASTVSSSDDSKGVDLVFYGDSITKLWKDGTPAHNGMSDVYQRHFSNFSAAVLGVGGDQTANLWWRLENGEVFSQHPPKASIVLIGTNDLGAASCGVGQSGVIAAVSGVVSRIESIVNLLKQKNAETTVILVGLLPRGDSKQDNMFPQPNKFTAGIGKVNTALSSFAAGQNQLVYVDCTSQLLPDGKIYDSILPDGLHPSAEGLDRLASCLSPAIYQYATSS